MSNTFLLFAIVSVFLLLQAASAFDPMPTQDICVADFTNGAKPYDNLPLPCMDPAKAKPQHFFSDALSKPGNTTNRFGAAFTSLDSTQIPGGNGLGMTVTRLDMKPGGYYPLHVHQRATEVFIVIKGKMEVGFTTSAPKYAQFNQTIPEGGVFYVPPGLIHYQKNACNGNTLAYSVFNRQNPGLDSTAHSVFGSFPPMDSSYLSQAFHLDENTIRTLQGQPWL